MTEAEKLQLAELSAKVNTLSDTVAKLDITAAVTNAVTEAMKPMADQMAAINAADAARAEAEKAKAVDVIVNAGLLDKADAEELSAKALNALAVKAKPGIAFGLNATFTPVMADAEFAAYDMNAAMEGK